MVRRIRTLVDIIAVIISLVNSGNINSDNLKKIKRDSLVFFKKNGVERVKLKNEEKNLKTRKKILADFSYTQNKKA